MEGLEIVGHEGSTKIEVSVNPSEEKIVKLKAVRGGWNCSQTIESKLENIWAANGWLQNTFENDSFDFANNKIY